MSLIKFVGITFFEKAPNMFFSIHGVDEHDKCKLCNTIIRDNLLADDLST